jgi:hypothetical protein
MRSLRTFSSIPLTTPVEIPKNIPLKLTHADCIFFLGSCFGETIAEKMQQYKFKVVRNPQGVVFNPISIAMCIDRAVNNLPFTENDLVLDSIDGDIFHSWQHGREFSGTDKSIILKRVNEKLAHAQMHLLQSKAIFITLGTSFAYRHIETGTIVSNCHKQPSKLFEKIHLDSNEIVSCLKLSFEKLKAQNSGIHIVLTVSPVRHTKDGLVNNSLSKSNLIHAAHKLAADLQFVSYFPSYEIMIDELRDYRWFDDDLIHPNEMAKTVIFSRFSDCFLLNKTSALIRNIEAIKRDVQHKPIIQNCKAYERHLLNTLRKIENLQVSLRDNLITDAFHDEICFCENMLALIKDNSPSNN